MGIALSTPPSCQVMMIHVIIVKRCIGVVTAWSCVPEQRLASSEPFVALGRQELTCVFVPQHGPASCDTRPLDRELWFRLEESFVTRMHRKHHPLELVHTRHIMTA